VEHFGADKPLRRITAGDAEDWHHWLTTHEELADNTVRRRTGIAKQFFKAALNKQLVDANPFDGLTSSVRGNPDKFYFVTRPEATKILDACPDAQWRLLFALARYGGLRCPSEHLALTWDDVNWAEERITIHSPKTERHPGKATRVIPIFPELRPYLDEVYNQAPDGTVHLITRYRDTGVNLRSQLLKIIARAGVKPWPKLWQNLRATRQTELADEFPNHVVCQWVGNSPRVAQEHYLRVTDEHFRAATSPERAASALHQRHPMSTKEKKGGGKKSKKPREKRGIGARCHSLVDDQVGDDGLEHSADSPMNCAVSAERAAHALHSDENLERILAAWDQLPVDVREDVANLVARFAEID
jgi:hypothetical protein